ncbi:MAG: hypothetical protein P4M11_01970 [Candidatus Pacebacteria bacterium]|nr:hypothetical protein [Candidatus Paceibacterota bacterium]
MSHKAFIERRVRVAYEAVPAHIKEDICEAAAWARTTLTNHEGSGHSIDVTAAGSKHPGMVVCSFAKPQWPSDHCGRPMELGSEAIVMAVCEYLNGA